jgi:diaminopimelate epimerase
MQATRFTKMHGIGNDFVMVDADPESLVSFADSELHEISRRLCHRKFGIGGDGLILVLPSDSADFRMRMFNPDGSEAEMCGNGIRCFAKYVYDRGKTQSEQITVDTKAGVMRLDLEVEGQRVSNVRVDMGRPILRREHIPMTGAGPSPVVDESISVDGEPYRLTAVSMGNPHVIIFTDDVSAVPLERIGPRIETHAFFPARTNVHFVQIHSPREITMRTWERGAGATLACGTGACASVVASALNEYTGRSVLAHLPGGDLRIEWSEDDHVYMSGPAETVFQGEIELGIRVPAGL